MKAMLLAAGRGTRMRHLTHNTPKPLLRLRGRSIIEYSLLNLAAIGVSEVVINVRSHADQFHSVLGAGEAYGLHITYSHEEGVDLGTGGGIARALTHLGSQPFILMSGDVWSEYTLQNLLPYHSMQQLAHLVMAPNPPDHRSGDFALDEDGVLRYGRPTYTYAGIAVLHPGALATFKSDAFSLGEVLATVVDSGQASGEIYEGLWHNIGTPEQLDALNNA